MAQHNDARMATRKARRKDNAARITAQSTATMGGAKARRPGAPDEHGMEGHMEHGPEHAGSMMSGSMARPEHSVEDMHHTARSYIAGEHVRRETGSRLLILDLQAPDAPEDRLRPFMDPDGAVMHFAVECLTHHTMPRYFADSAQAHRAAKTSHKWCDGCMKAVGSSTQKMRSRARAQTMARV
jgi:hypothetical protein